MVAIRSNKSQSDEQTNRSFISLPIWKSRRRTNRACSHVQSSIISKWDWNDETLHYSVWRENANQYSSYLSAFFVLTFFSFEFCWFMRNAVHRGPSWRDEPTADYRQLSSHGVQSKWLLNLRSWAEPRRVRNCQHWPFLASRIRWILNMVDDVRPTLEIEVGWMGQAELAKHLTGYKRVLVFAGTLALRIVGEKFDGRVARIRESDGRKT